jgi:hypothetical protein
VVPEATRGVASPWVPGLPLWDVYPTV